VNPLVVRDVLHVEGAQDSLSQSRLMDRELRIVPVNGYIIKIYDKAPAIRTGCGHQGNHVAVAPQAGDLFGFDVNVARKGCQSRDGSSDKRYREPNTILNEHTYTDILQAEEPNTQDRSVPIASTPATNRPLAAGNGNSKGGNPGSSSAGLLKDRADSSDENDEEDVSEDEDDPPVVIDKSKRSSFTPEFAGLNGDLGSEWEAPAGSHWRRSRTIHRRRRSGRLEV